MAFRSPSLGALTLRVLAAFLALGLLLGAGSFAAANAAEDTVYLSGIDDVPLMEGLTEDRDAGVVFDKPSGRIVEGVAGGKVTPSAVIAFYKETLPELGWALDGAGKNDLHFHRDTEVLSVTVDTAKDRSVVTFSLTPSKTAPQSPDPDQ
jgi:hypothetical protein